MYSQKGKGRGSRGKMEKGKPRPYVWGEIPLYEQTARMHAQTKRNNFQVRLTPNLRFILSRLDWLDSAWLHWLGLRKWEHPEIGTSRNRNIEKSERADRAEHFPGPRNNVREQHRVQSPPETWFWGRFERLRLSCDHSAAAPAELQPREGGLI